MAKTRGIYEHPKGSGVWYTQYFHAGKRYRERVGTKSDALKLYMKRKTEILMGQKLPELRRKKVTVGELADLALAYAKQHNKSVRDYVTKAAIVKEAIGNRTADEIGPDEIEEFLGEREITDATFNRYRAFISLAYKEGIRLGKVKDNVAKRIKQRSEGRGRKRFLSRDEYGRLLDAVKNPIDRQHMKHLCMSEGEEFQVSVLSGMRLSEQYTVEWWQLDFERNEIGLTKTKNGEDRTVHMNSEVAAILQARKERIKPKRKDRVFPRKGKNMDTRSWFHPALEAAEVENYVWHCNRHTFCSWLAIAGVPLKTIQELAGHKTISITAQYAHLCPDHKGAEIEKILTPPEPKVVEMKRRKA